MANMIEVVFYSVIALFAGLKVAQIIKEKFLK